jgi:SsrA-binding protein
MLQNERIIAIIKPMTAQANKDKDKDKQDHVAVNKKAYRNFELVEKFEAGLELLGSEVKSLRAAAADLTGSYARVDNGQCWLVGAQISPYQQAGARQHEPTRKRKLLLHRAQIHRIRLKLEQRGFTLVPLRIYFNKRGIAKIEVALARGKRQYDKRDTITKRDQRRDMDRDMKKYRK